MYSCLIGRTTRSTRSSTVFLETFISRLLSTHSRSRTRVSLFSTKSSTNPVTMEVTNDNFEAVFPSIVEALSSHSCRFLAIDTEFTGLSTKPAMKEHYIDTLEERYQKVREAGQNFLITQFGLSSVHQDPETRSWSIRTWNFYLFPRPYQNLDQRFMCQASSLHFLAQHGFDFNKFIHDGISFMKQTDSAQMLDYLNKDIHRLEKKSSHSLSTTDAFDFSTLKAIDQEYALEIENDIRTWINHAAEAEIPDKLSPLILQSNNSFQRFVIHTVVGQKFSDLYSEHVSGGSVEITRINAAERAQKERAKIDQMRQKWSTAVGFTRVFELMTEAKVPIVGHNALLDFVYMFRQFHSDLPSTLVEFKTQLHTLFPEIYDTKHLALSMPEAALSSTSLEPLFQELSLTTEKASRMLMSDHSEYHVETNENQTSKAHDAGYDSYMTAMVFLGLHVHPVLEEEEGGGEESTSLVIPHPSFVAHHQNRLNLMFSDVEALNLEDLGQQVERKSVYSMTEVVSGPRNKKRKIVWDDLFEAESVQRVAKVSAMEHCIFLYEPLLPHEFQTLVQKAAARNLKMEAFQDYWSRKNPTQTSPATVEVDKDEDSGHHCYIM